MPEIQHGGNALPRSGGGTYSLPSTYEAVSGETIEAQQHNDPLEDLAADANAARPISAGGTGEQTAIAAADAFSTRGSAIASATTTDIGAATGRFVHITGTTTITGFGTKTAGVVRIVTFDGALTLTHNATSLILPGAANITTAAGDTAFMVSEGSGNWRCIGYMRANGQLIVNTLTSPTITTPTISAPSITTSLTLTYTDDGAAGPDFITVHDSASPAANDVLAAWKVRARDSAGNLDTVAGQYAYFTDPTSGSEDSRYEWATMVAGTLGFRMHLGAGLYLQGATGTDKGAGTINATAVYANGVRVGGSPDVVLEDQKSAGSNGGTFTSGSWQTRTLNTEARDIGGLCTLSSNEFTMTVDGWVEWDAPACGVFTHQTRLYNVTDTAVVKSGSTERSDNGDHNVTTRSRGGAAVVAGKTYRLEHRSGSTKSTFGFGSSANMGETEVYSTVRFWRTA